jgi:hypothetical protein
MFRLIRVPPSLAHFFHPLQGPLHGNPFGYFRLLVLAIACRWGGRHVTSL